MNNTYKAQGEAAKQVRRGVEDARPVPNKKKKKVDKPWDLLYRDRRWGSYATQEQAVKQMEKQRRGWPVAPGFVGVWTVVNKKEKP